MNEIKIPISKKKIILILLGAIVLIVLGFWLAIEPEKFIDNIFGVKNEYQIRNGGIIATILFAILGLLWFKKLFDKKDGLIINDDGIIDNSNGTSVGLIKWNDIIGFRTEQVFSQKFIMVDVKNPDYYIEQKKNKLGKNAMIMNYEKFGSPLSIISSSLDYKFGELEKLLDSELKKRKTN
jgi:hypothetical protein